MSNIANSTRKNKHLTFDDRLTIEAMLKSPSTFSEIARTIGKDASTISKEVRKHRELAANNWTRRDDSGRVLNDECPKLAHPPYVCNGCKQKPYCHLKRLVYRAKSAQKDYEALRSESRTGIALNNLKSRHFISSVTLQVIFLDFEKGRYYRMISHLKRIA